MSGPGMISVGRRMGRWVWGAIRRSLRPSGLLLVYDPRYVVQVGSIPMDPLRAEMVLAFLTDEGLIRRRELLRPQAASMKNLRRVHTDKYLESLQHTEVVEQVVGAQLTDAEAQGLVEFQRLAAGGTVLATAAALRTGLVTVNLGGGFHHAASNRGMGFCAFNDLAIAIARLRARGFEAPILVVDLDIHDGNGTRLLFEDDPTVHTFTIHNQDWSPRDAVAATVIALGTAVNDATYLKALREALPPVIAAGAPRTGPLRGGGRPRVGRHDRGLEHHGRRDARPGPVRLRAGAAGGSGDSAGDRPRRRLRRERLAVHGAVPRMDGGGPHRGTTHQHRHAHPAGQGTQSAAARRRAAASPGGGLGPHRGGRGRLSPRWRRGAAPTARPVHGAGRRTPARAARRALAGAGARLRAADPRARLPPRRFRHRAPLRRRGAHRTPHGDPLPPRLDQPARAGGALPRMGPAPEPAA